MSRRGHYLFMFGIIYLFLGMAVLFDQSTDDLVTAAINRIVPPPIYGLLSVTTAIYCMVIAWHGRKGWWQNIAFSALALLVCYRSVAHVYAAIEFQAWNQLYPFFIWVALARIHILVAGWVEPPPHTVAPVPFSEAIITTMAEELMRKDRLLEEYQRNEKKRAD